MILRPVRSRDGEWTTRRVHPAARFLAFADHGRGSGMRPSGKFDHGASLCDSAGLVLACCSYSHFRMRREPSEGWYTRSVRWWKEVANSRLHLKTAVRDQKAGGSNPLALTIHPLLIQSVECVIGSGFSPLNLLNLYVNGQYRELRHLPPSRRSPLSKREILSNLSFTHEHRNLGLDF